MRVGGGRLQLRFRLRGAARMWRQQLRILGGTLGRRGWLLREKVMISFWFCIYSFISITLCLYSYLTDLLQTYLSSSNKQKTSRRFADEINDLLFLNSLPYVTLWPAPELQLSWLYFQVLLFKALCRRRRSLHLRLRLWQFRFEDKIMCRHLLDFPSLSSSGWQTCGNDKCLDRNYFPVK